jgi:PiT family inorganic phosphate transporter
LDISNGSDISSRDRPTKGHVVFISYSISDRTVPWSSRRGKITLITAGALPKDAGPPFWVILSSGLAIALGTYLGGWRIIQTLGKRVSEIQTPQGFAAETASAAVILTSANLGFALSTTQVAAGSIFGAGAGRRLATVQWSVAGQMAVAWLLTLPAAAVVGAVAAWTASTGPWARSSSRSC